MVKREEVEALAELANDPTISSMRLMLVNPETVRELARTWLSVDGAETFTVVESGWNDDGYDFDGRIFHLPTDLIGQRVKLVLVPEAGEGAIDTPIKTSYNCPTEAHDGEE